MQHINVLNLTLTPPSSLELNNAQVYSLGPYLQGVLMEHIDTSYAAHLHRLAFNPYSLRCLPNDDGSLNWQVVALTDEAHEQVTAPLCIIPAVRIWNLDAEFEVSGRQLTSIPLKDLTDLLALDNPVKARIRVQTPAAFKSAGEYVFLPSVRLVFQNLLMRYFAVYEGSKEVDADTLEYLCGKVKITSYNIRSQYFDHAMGQGRKVPAFTGTLGFTMKGPQQLRGLCWMMLRFGEYAGLGIKTSMGMGAMMCLK